MHQLNVLILGPQSFISTLNELEQYLKFNCTTNNSNNYEVIFFHSDVLNEKKYDHVLKKTKILKICAFTKNRPIENFDAFIELPATLKDINAVVENNLIKKEFGKNSSIKIKNYLLDKNKKILFNKSVTIDLTEKEIKLLDLFLKAKKPISKDNILSSVWNYSKEADTHTVETHIYRLRKKIIEKFSDDKFILNNKDGYYL